MIFGIKNEECRMKKTSEARLNVAKATARKGEMGRSPRVNWGFHRLRGQTRQGFAEGF